MDGPSIEFSDKSIRQAFIVKVYTILFLELALSMSIICTFCFTESIKQGLSDNFDVGVAILFFGFFGFLLVSYTFACVPSSRKTVPLNFILLTLAVLCMSLVLGVVSSIYETKVVLLAMTATFSIVAFITIMAAVCPFDITSKGMYLFIIGAVFSMALTVAFIMSIFMKMELVWTILVSIGVFVICAFLLYDTQLIIGGRHVEISPEEYIFAATVLFMDVANLYMYILYLFGGGSRS